MNKIKLILTIAVVSLFFISSSYAANPYQIKRIQRDKKDGDREIVLKSGFILELDKRGRVEVETSKGKDIGDRAILIRKPSGKYDVAVLVKNTHGLVFQKFMHNVMANWDTDGDMEIMLNQRYKLEIDKGEVGEPKGSMEIEDMYTGKDIK